MRRNETKENKITKRRRVWYCRTRKTVERGAYVQTSESKSNGNFNAVAYTENGKHTRS